jgi:uncharacterized protein YecT (DUF1311 family)
MMRMQWQWVVPALIVAGATPAGSQTQTEMTAAAGAKAASAERALNTQYRSTIEALSPGSKTKLRNAQRAWIVFRDAECGFESSGVEDGSAYPMVRAACMERMATERSRQLKARTSCQEGDLSCPR